MANIASHQLLDWLREREATARRLAQTAQDRGAWLEDADYFNAAATRVWEFAECVAALKDMTRIATAASIGAEGNQPRIARARVAIALATPPQSPSASGNVGEEK